MGERLSAWSPSEATTDLLKLNGLSDELIAQAVEYLKNNTELEDIDDIDGYSSWNAFFIMFAIKAAGSPNKDLLDQ